jgi:NAD(P)H-nitrite reductase large subunit
MEHIVIIGNGIAGVTCARHIRKQSNKKITLISAEAEHFFSRTALMYIYMGHMNWDDIKPYEDWFWEKNDIQLKKAYVTTVDTKNKTLRFSEGGTMTYDKLVIASGSTTKLYGWEGQDLAGVVGLVTKQDLEELEKIAPNRNQCPRAVIVGGGLIGVELAEMLRTRNIEVTFLVREDAFWTSALPKFEGQLLSRHIQSHGVDLRHSTELECILGDGNGRVRGVRTKNGEEILCNMVGITTGVTPNISFLKNSGIETDKGVLVNRLLETNVADVYAIGDCAQQRNPIGNRPAVQTIWYTGRMMGETLAQTLCGTPWEYSPGPWFNSAKFFDIEFQNYGWVQPERSRKAHEEQFHWKHNTENKFLTVAYHKESREFLGINTFGIRMRHPVFDKWLRERESVDTVMEQLAAANFDPEFYKRHEKSILNAFYSEEKQLAQ